MLVRISALLQILFLLLILGYGVFELFRGNFGVMFATMPFLLIYYFFLTTRKRRGNEDQGEIR